MSQKPFDKLDELHARLVVFSHGLESFHECYEFGNEFSVVALGIAAELAEVISQLTGSKTA